MTIDFIIIFFRTSFTWSGLFAALLIGIVYGLILLVIKWNISLLPGIFAGIFSAMAYANTLGTYWYLRSDFAVFRILAILVICSAIFSFIFNILNSFLIDTFSGEGAGRFFLRLFFICIVNVVIFSLIIFAIYMLDYGG